MAVVTLKLPPEFVERCEERNVAPDYVLCGFVADLCNIETRHGEEPKYPGYGTNGSDERALANEYFDRAHLDLRD